MAKQNLLAKQVGRAAATTSLLSTISESSLSHTLNTDYPDNWSWLPSDHHPAEPTDDEYYNNTLNFLNSFRNNSPPLSWTDELIY